MENINDLITERKKRITEYINSPAYVPLKVHELAVVIDVPAEDRPLFEEVIDSLSAEGVIVITKKGKIMPAAKMNIYPGIFTGNARGFGFVRIEGRESDIFIPPDRVGGAMNKDKVLIKITGESRDGKRAEGEVLRIIEKGSANIVGTFEAIKGYGFVTPDDRKEGRDIFIPEGKTKGAVTGHKVVVKVTKRSDGKSSAEGIVTEILGHADDPGVDILSVALQFDLPTEFPDSVLRQIKKIDPDKIDESIICGREDMRDILTVTIDGDDSKDFDDAVSIKKNDDGTFTLGVHIADVTEYVKEGSPLDREALKRGTSVYLVDRVIPMLPHKLSNGICSLNPNADRLALSCIMDIDRSGNVTNHRIAKSVIRSDRRMTYNIVNEIIEGERAKYEDEYGSLFGMFDLMAELRGILLEKRRKHGSINFDLPECEIKLDKNGRPVDIRPRDRNTAMSVIEEFMLICNETIAEDFFWRDIPFVYRNHETPDSEKIKELSGFIYGFGYRLKGSFKEEIHPGAIADLLESVKGKPEERIISRAALRSMKQAKYMPQNLGHFGLAAKYYCHFTSPIRRYPDLQIHRIIKETLDGEMDEKRMGHYASILPEVCEHSSKTERNAEDAEREADRLKQVQYMTEHIGETFSGIVSGVTSFGVFVELPNTVEGLISMESLTDDFYRYDEKGMCLEGVHTGRKIYPGTKMTVTVKNADIMTRTIDFEETYI